jgi:tetratricopeptide (TPR) repeat protein
VGRWHDAVVANQTAIAADNDYLATCGPNAKGVYPLGYVPHNPHFLWFAASMEGASKVAQDAARTTAKRVNLPDLMRQPGFAGLQHYWMTPWFDNVRFGRWDEIRAVPNPAPDLPYVTAVWNYAQAMAAIRQGRTEDAKAHYSALSKLAADPIMPTLMVWDRYPLAHAAQIAERTVYAELALARRDETAAITALTEAVTIEDRIPYDEPPGWHSPVRQSLGAALLDAGRAGDAERVYREELRRNPQNGWSLKGLALALRQQQKMEDAVAVEKQLQAAWQHADVPLMASRF